MICPYCKTEMAPGTIEAHNLLQWIPDEEHTHGATLWAKSEHSIILAKYFLLFPATIVAFHCSKCKKIIIDIPEE